MNTQVFEMPSIMILQQQPQIEDVAYFGIGIIPPDAKPPYSLPVMYVIYPILLVFVIVMAAAILFKMHK